MVRGRTNFANGGSRQQDAVTWLAILNGVLTAANALLSWMRERQLVEAGRAEVLAGHLQAALNDIGKARAARDAVRRDVERDPSKLRDDDGFKRPD